MKIFAIVAAAFCLTATAALAEDSCQIQATGKNLHGAALTSFAKKCCKDQAAAQKLREDVAMAQRIEICHAAFSATRVAIKRGRVRATLTNGPAATLQSVAPGRWGGLT